MVSPNTTACSAVGFQVKLVRAPGAYEAKKISSSSGIARKNSTIAPAGPLIHQRLESRATPKMIPNASARTAAIAAAFNVPTRPGSI